MKKNKNAWPLAIRVQTFVLAALLVVSIIPKDVLAKETIPMKQAEEENIITPENIVGVEVIDGEIYIDVLEPYLYPYPFIDLRGSIRRSAVGKCTKQFTDVKKHMTKEEVIKKKEQCDRGDATAGALIGFLVGSAGGGLIGGAIGTGIGVISSGPSMFSVAAEKALYYNNKSKYTVKTIFQCEDSNMGSRGWVHRYKLYAIEIY